MEIEIIKVLVYGFCVILIALFAYITALAILLYVKLKDIRQIVYYKKKDYSS